MGAVNIITKLVSGQSVHLLELPDAKSQISKMGTCRVKVLKGHNDPLAKIHTKVVVGLFDQLPKSMQYIFSPYIVMGIRVSKMFLIYETFLFLYFL